MPTNVKKAMLSTIDNPFNPFVQFDDWLAYDEHMGYYSCSYLARIANVSDDLSDELESLAISQAIDEIVEINLTGKYIKVTEDNFLDRSKNNSR
jgi:hypothetical protein